MARSKKVVSNLTKKVSYVWHFLSNSGLYQIWITKTLLQPTFIKWILYVLKYFILNTAYLIIRNIFLVVFAIYRSKVNTSLKNNIVFENTYFPSKFSKWCSESLKEHDADKILSRSDEKITILLKIQKHVQLSP